MLLREFLSKEHFVISLLTLWGNNTNKRYCQWILMTINFSYMSCACKWPTVWVIFIASVYPRFGSSASLSHLTKSPSFPNCSQLDYLYCHSVIGTLFLHVYEHVQSQNEASFFNLCVGCQLCLLKTLGPPTFCSHINKCIL